MYDVSEHRFTFTLGDLPRGKFVTLSDALNLAFYGGMPSIRYERPIPQSAAEVCAPSMTDDEWILNTDEGTIRGPRLVEVARPGAILFGIEDSSEFCRTQPSAEGVNVAHAPVPRRLEPDVDLPFWKAETVRRHAAFCSKLSIAARSGDVRFMGTPVDGPWSLEPSTFGTLPQDIPAAYFIMDRDFDEDSCISAIGPEAPEPDYDEASADGRYVSYRDVVVERASFISFLKTYYPAVLNANLAREQLTLHEDIKRLTQALLENKDLTKRAAAGVVGRSHRSRPFEKIWPIARKAAGLDEHAPVGRKRKSTQI